MAQLTQYEQNAIQKLGESIYAGKWSNAGMVQLIKLLDEHLNPKTIAKYAADKGMSYNGIKKSGRQCCHFGGVKFLIDNE